MVCDISTGYPISISIRGLRNRDSTVKKVIRAWEGQQSVHTNFLCYFLAIQWKPYGVFISNSITSGYADIHV